MSATGQGRSRGSERPSDAYRRKRRRGQRCDKTVTRRERSCQEVRDYYWSIPNEKLYSIYEEPTGFTVGQLSDDLQEVRK